MHLESKNTLKIDRNYIFKQIKKRNLLFGRRKWWQPSCIQGLSKKIKYKNI